MLWPARLAWLFWLWLWLARRVCLVLRPVALRGLVFGVLRALAFGAPRYRQSLQAVRFLQMRIL